MRRKHRQSHLGHRRRSVVAVVMVVALILVAAAAGGGYLLLRTKGSPQQTEASYLSGWQHGDYAAMDRVSVNVPRSGLAVSLRQAAAELGLRRIRLAPGPVTVSGGSAAMSGPTPDGCSWSGRTGAGGCAGARPRSTLPCGQVSGSCSAPRGRRGPRCSRPAAPR